MRRLTKVLFECNSKISLKDIPTLKSFINPSKVSNIPTSTSTFTFHIETYGCQMNVNDSDIIRSVLSQKYREVDDPKDAQVLLLNTCAIRQSAEQKIYQRIRQASKSKVIGVLGCMAERLKEKMFKEGVHVVCGPDAYRDLPRLVGLALQDEQAQMNVQLSAEQTYADITPVRKNKNSVSAYLSIMRGCNNMCSFCIVPFVRGRERSRNLSTILQQIQELERQGVKEITFLGQNVNSYHDSSTQAQSSHRNSEGFGQTFKTRDYPGVRFTQLLQSAAVKFPNIRFRFTSPHPKDFPVELLQIIAKYPNLCKSIHLPAQSGNTQMLMKMRRNYSREAYIKLVQKMRSLIPNLTLSTDLISGFCGQTEQQFQDTISLIKMIKFEMAYLFAYSMRERTHAHRNFDDDVPESIKQRRLKQMIDTFVQVQSTLNQKQIGQIHVLLLQGKAKRDQAVLMGKTDHFKNGYVKLQKVPVYSQGKVVQQREFKIGDYLIVKVQSVGSRSLYCKPIGIASTLNEYFQNKQLFSHQPVQ